MIRISIFVFVSFGMSVLNTAMAGETADTAIASCLSVLNLPAATCTCIGERAEAELSDAEQVFFIAMIAQNQTAADAIQGGVTLEQMTTVGTFMTNAPEQCAGQ